MGEAEISRLGREADYILSSEAFQKAMAELDSGLVELWAAGEFATPAEREEIFARVRGARMFRERLIAMVNSMKISESRAETRAKQAIAAGNARGRTDS